MTGSPPTASSAPGSPVLLLAGPTASGKSAIAMALAERLDGEIVSADSMQVYQGLDIGSAKPSSADRQRIPHHLVDVAAIAEPFDAARWLEGAQAACADIARRGRVPIICGGTGLYFRAWIDGLDAPPPSSPALREELERLPLEALLRELELGDPETHRRIDRNNPRRVVRAVEILRSGRVRSGSSNAAGRSGLVRVIRRSPAELHRRIELRVDQMFAAGLVGETRRLLELGLASNRTACQAIGYRQVIEHLEGRMDLAAAVALVKIKTRQFARRQQTWFRHQVPSEYVEVPSGEAPEITAERIRDRAMPNRGIATPPSVER